MGKAINLVVGGRQSNRKVKILDDKKRGKTTLRRL